MVCKMWLACMHFINKYVNKSWDLRTYLDICIHKETIYLQFTYRTRMYSHKLTIPWQQKSSIICELHKQWYYRSLVLLIYWNIEEGDVLYKREATINRANVTSPYYHRSKGTQVKIKTQKRQMALGVWSPLIWFR